MEKKCFKCNEIKPLGDFYKHPRMADGTLNKCKNCTRLDTKKNTDKNLKDPEWVKSEQARHREKYHRLGYKEKHKPSKESKSICMDKFYKKYPEKYKAKIYTQKMTSVNGNFHHWSYNDEHLKDVIDLNPKDHLKAHRFIIYDQERMMYRGLNGILLDTKEKHLNYIMDKIKNEPD
jgi:hypothetical protein